MLCHRAVPERKTFVKPILFIFYINYINIYKCKESFQRKLKLLHLKAQCIMFVVSSVILWSLCSGIYRQSVGRD